jgi:uncharacterized protein YjbJ (UPF0337 family)
MDGTPRLSREFNQQAIRSEDKQFVLRRRKMIDKNRIKGSAEQAKGRVKEWAGRALGDKKTESEGKADQVKGKVQNAVGGLKDAVRGK